MTKTVVTYCSECDGNKNHKKLFSKIPKRHSKSIEEFSVVECMGCNTVSFLQTIRLSKKSKPIHVNYPDDEVLTVYNILPDQFLSALPKKLRGLYDEVA